MTSFSRRLFVKDRINNFEFLIDSGADVSVIPHTFFLNNQQEPQYSLSAANGSTINTYGNKILTIDLGIRRKFVHNFILANVNRPIIGADFLSKFELLIDLRKRRLIDSKTNLSINVISIKVDTPTPVHYAIDNDYGSVLREFPTLLSPPDYSHPVKHSVVHYITTTGQLPFSKPRRLDAKKHKTGQTEFAHMIDLGICRPSFSPVSSPLHMVHKKKTTVTIGVLVATIVD